MESQISATASSYCTVPSVADMLSPEGNNRNAKSGMEKEFTETAIIHFRNHAFCFKEESMASPFYNKIRDNRIGITEKTIQP